MSDPSVFTRARLELLAAAILFSTGGAAVKACTFTSWQVASFRSLFAAVTLFLLMRAAPPLWSYRAVAVGFAYGATMTLFVLANKLTTAANTIFLQSTAPLYVLVAGPWLLREHLRQPDLLFMVALAAGLGLFFVSSEPPRYSAPNPALGNLVAVLSGVTWAMTLVGLRWTARGAEAERTTTAALIAGNFVAFFFNLPLALPVEEGAAKNWLIVAALGVFQVGLSYVLLSRGVKHVSAFETSLLMLIEPVLSPIWAWALHGERPGPWALAGGAVILAATALKTTLDRAPHDKNHIDR